MSEFNIETVVVVLVFCILVLWVIGKISNRKPKPPARKAPKRSDSGRGAQQLGEKVLCQDCGVEYHYPQFTRCLACNQAKLAKPKRSRLGGTGTTRSTSRREKPRSSGQATSRRKHPRNGAGSSRRTASPRVSRPPESKSVMRNGKSRARKRRVGLSPILSGRYKEQFLRELRNGFIGREWWK